jgi:glycerol-3-phosphate dehydrogenase
MLPWHGHALLRTTNTDFDGDPASVQPDQADIDCLLAAVNRVLNQPLTTCDVMGSFAGLRALAIEPGRSPSENTCEYRFREERGIKNFITICGGKLTTARALGEPMVDRISAELGGGGASSSNVSRTAPLPGGNTGLFEEFVRKAGEQARKDFGVPVAAADRIVRTYGSRWIEVLNPIRHEPALAQPLAGNPALLAAEVVFAVRQEMAANADDVLLRRSGPNWLAACSLRDAASAVAQIFARELGWTADRQQASLGRFLNCCVVPSHAAS